MMKHLHVFALCAFFGTAKAQDMIGLFEQSPDWTATDINGNSHTLSQYLNDGYTVILDFIVPWCEPCVEMHESQVLHTLYNNYGPNSNSADHKIMVFMISYTDVPYLNGGQSIDWVTGTPYPIITHTPILDAYGVIAFPRVLTICPSGMIVSTQSSALLDNMLNACLSCEHLTADSPNDATLLPGEDPGCLDETDDRHVPLYNVGTSPLTSVAIEAVDCYTNEVLSSTVWTGTLTSYAQTLVTVPGWSAPPGDRCVRYRIATPDDDALNDLSPEIYYHSPVGTSATTTITVEILTDDNGAEWTWFLAGENFETPAWVPEGEYEANTFYTHTVEVTPDACWNFSIANWSSPTFEAPSYYLVKCGDDVLISEANTTQMTGGAVMHQAYFISGEATAITEPVVAAPEFYLSDSRHLTISGAQPRSILLLVDPAGRMVRSERLSGTSAVVDLSGLNSGAYAVTVASETGRFSRTFVVTE